MLDSVRDLCEVNCEMNCVTNFCTRGIRGQYEQMNTPARDIVNCTRGYLRAMQIIS